MAATALTKRVVDAARYRGNGSSRDVRWDASVPGFGCRVYPSGRKSFVLSFRTRAGRSRLLALGPYGVLTVEAARNQAREKLVDVRRGADPVAEKRAEKKAGKAAKTLKEAAEYWIETHAEPHRRSWKEDARRIRTHIVPALGHLALWEVRRSDVASLHAKIGRTRAVEANRVVSTLRTIYYKTMAWSKPPPDFENPAKTDPKGIAGIRPFTEKSRKRYVTPTEMPVLWDAIGKEPNIYARAALKLYLLTGLRKSELIRAAWAELDLVAANWRIPQTKQDEPHFVQLSAPAVELLSSLPRVAGNPYVFPGRKRGTHLANINKNWRAVRETAGLEDVTLHDLRRTVGSWLATSGVSLAIIGQVLGHAPGDVAATAIYARLERDAARSAMEDHANMLMEVVGATGVEARLGDLVTEGDPETLANQLRALAAKLEAKANS